MLQEKSVILAVDDEPQNMHIIKEIFEEDFELKLAYSGDEALEMLNELRPDIVLLDIMMPGMDGYQVCQKIRENRNLQFTKTIIVSAKAMMDEKLKGYALGANDYVTKPFNDEELLAKVNSWIQLKYTEEIELLKANIYRFFSDELRKPLNSVLGFSHFLQKSPSLTEEDKMQLNHIIQAGNYLLDLSDRALLAHDLKEKEHVNQQHEDIAVIIESMLLLVREKSDEVNINVSANPVIAKTMIMDPSLIEKALTYLMEVVVDISSPGASVMMSCSEHDNSYKMVIQSNNLDLKDHELEGLFKDSSLDVLGHYQKGLAFALSIARSIFRKHGGDIFLLSGAHQSSFVAQLPTS